VILHSSAPLALQGIQPDIDVAEGALPAPGSQGGFCRAISLPDAPALFK